jgi:hypothetical protein
MKTLTINLPDSFEVKGMSDAPERLRQVATDKWNEKFCLEALRHGVSQPLGDCWSTQKRIFRNWKRNGKLSKMGNGPRESVPDKRRPNSKPNLMNKLNGSMRMP